MSENHYTYIIGPWKWNNKEYKNKSLENKIKSTAFKVIVILMGACSRFGPASVAG